MNITEYRQNTLRTLPDLGEALTTAVENSIHEEHQLAMSKLLKIHTQKLNLAHMALGWADEIGELISCIGTELKTNIDKINLKEELGDFWWYFANYCNMRDIDIPEDPQIEGHEEDCMELLIVNTGELIGLVKKFLAYNREIDKEKERDYIYNIRIALAQLSVIYEIPGSIIRERNIAKLNDKNKGRYKEGFSDAAANNRNTSDERELLSE